MVVVGGTGNGVDGHQCRAPRDKKARGGFGGDLLVEFATDLNSLAAIASFAGGDGKFLAPLDLQTARRRARWSERSCDRGASWRCKELHLILGAALCRLTTGNAERCDQQHGREWFHYVSP